MVFLSVNNPKKIEWANVGYKISLAWPYCLERVGLHAKYVLGRRKKYYRDYRYERTKAAVFNAQKNRFKDL